VPFTLSTPTGLPSRRWGTLNVIYNPAGCGGDSTDASPDYYAEGGLTPFEPSAAPRGRAGALHGQSFHQMPRWNLAADIRSALVVCARLRSALGKPPGEELITGH